MPQKSEKLVTVLVTSTSMTEKTEEIKELEWIPSIWYFVTFKDQIEALLDSKSEINTMNLAFAHQFGIKI